jgi:5,10-methenyltetrahydrofolate synthetase
MKEYQQNGGSFASPPCYAHELDPLYRDAAAPDAATWRDVERWRKAERERLLKQRGRLSTAAKARELADICGQLDWLLANSEISILGVYWPIHGEPDLRAWMRRQSNRGLVIALPVIRERNRPLHYSRWQPGCAMRRGHWGIAEPQRDDWLEPQMVLAPLVGVDGNRHRLGYGGGYFDRSLAVAQPRRQAAGIGYRCSRIDTIYPQPHDIEMDFVITG